MKSFFGLVLLVVAGSVAAAVTITIESSTNICSALASCTECVTSEQPCSWCIETHRCATDDSLQCQNDILVRGLNVSIHPLGIPKAALISIASSQTAGSSIRRGPATCPRIVPKADDNEIHVSAGEVKSIMAKIEAAPPFILSHRLSCRFNIEDRYIESRARLFGETIYCDPIEFDISSNEKTVTTALELAYGDDGKVLDNPEHIRVIISRVSS